MSVLVSVIRCEGAMVDVLVWRVDVVEEGKMCLGSKKSACVHKRLPEVHVCLPRADAACMLLQLGT